MGKHMPDCLCFLGTAILVTAAWLLHPAAALALAGSLLIGLGVYLHRRGQKPS